MKKSVGVGCVVFVRNFHRRLPGSGYHGNVGVDEIRGAREEQEESKEVYMCPLVFGLIASLSRFLMAKQCDPTKFSLPQTRR